MWVQVERERSLKNKALLEKEEYRAHIHKLARALKRHQVSSNILFSTMFRCCGTIRSFRGVRHGGLILLSAFSWNVLATVSSHLSFSVCATYFTGALVCFSWRVCRASLLQRCGIRPVSHSFSTGAVHQPP